MNTNFRLQHNVPDVYPKFSRDFQLICNAFDVINNGVQFDIYSMTDILDTARIKENMIPLLQTKLGFFTEKNFNAEELRVILRGFRNLLRDKGTLKGVQEAVTLYLRVIKTTTSTTVTIQNRVKASLLHKDDTDYILEIGIGTRVHDVDILEELLRFVLPTGYRLKIYFHEFYEAHSVVEDDSVVKIVYTPVSMNAGVKDSSSNLPLSDVSLTGINGDVESVN